MSIYAFACSVKGAPQWGESILNRATSGQAKAYHWRNVNDSWPDVQYTDVRARKVGGPVTTADFMRNAKYRGMPDVKCGQRVKVGKEFGAIVGHNSSANFDVLFDEGGKFSGMTLNVHPHDVELVTDINRPEVQP